MIKNKRSKSNFFNKNSNFPSLQDLSTKTTNKIGHRKSGFDRIYNKELNINNFIKQKNKFFISNFFDEKESKKFMDSKDLALKEIKLNDKIENYKNTNDKPNNRHDHKKKGKQKHSDNSVKKMANAAFSASSPVKSQFSPVKTVSSSNNSTKSSTPVSSPVKPAIKYHENTVIEIRPSHEGAPLNKAINDPGNYVDVDNSVDGFLAIKHDK